VPARTTTCFAIEVGADEPLHVRQAQKQAAGRNDRRERMAGAGYSDGEILTRGLAHERSQLVFRARLRLVPGDERLVANPVAPVPARFELRQRCSGDIGHAVTPLSCGASRIDRAAHRMREGSVNDTGG